MQVHYNGHASPGISDDSGLFSVIEDQFYKASTIIDNHTTSIKCFLPGTCWFPKFPSHGTEKEGFVIPPATRAGFLFEVNNSKCNIKYGQDFLLRPEVQTVPGYSSLMETRLGVAEERITRTPAPVSVASSHGRVKGPEYPRRPNLAPATLRPIARPTPPSRDRWLDLIVVLILLTGGGRMNMMSA